MSPNREFAVKIGQFVNVKQQEGGPIQGRFSALLELDTLGLYCFEVKANDYAMLRLNGKNVVDSNIRPGKNEVRGPLSFP